MNLPKPAFLEKLPKMPEIQLDLKQILLIALITQTALGVMLMVIGLLYTTIDTVAAEEMLSFIEKTNTEYYRQIISDEDPSYGKEFYSHYQKKGHRGILATGKFFLFMSMNIAIVFAYFTLTGGKAEEIVEELSDVEKFGGETTLGEDAEEESF